MEIKDEEIKLQDYLRIIRKHRWAILTVFAVIFVSVLIFTFTATPIYQATTRLIIEKDDPKVVSVQEVMSVDSSGLDYYQTQYRIIESRTVAREVIRRLNLGEKEEFVPKKEDESFLDSVLNSIRETIASYASLLKTEKTPQTAEQSGESEEEAALVTAFVKRVKVVPIRNSRLVDVGFQAKDPVLSASIANTLARAYIDLNLETKLNATKDAMNWLESRITEERKKVEQAEQALLRYKERHNIITDFSKDVENITAQKLAALNAQVIEAEVMRVEAETRYKQAVALEKTPDMLDSIPEVLNNDLIREIKTMEVELQKRKSELSKKYGVNHPQIVAIQSELATLKNRKNEEVKRVINSLYNSFKVAQAREQSLKSSLNRQKAESFTLNEKAINYSVLKREAQSTQQMYDLVIKRFKETALTENIRTGNIRIVDKAEVPIRPVKPKKTQNALLGMIIGLALGIGLAFLLEYMDNTIKAPDDIKLRLKIPYLGPVPVFAIAEPQKRGKKSGNPETPEQTLDQGLIVVHSPKSTASESYRGLRTSLLFSAADAPPKVVLVTSAAPSEGKTITAANIAVTMSQAGNRVLVIDSDLRRPKIHRVFNVSRDRGLSNILAGTCSIDEAILHATIPGVDIITSGPVPPNPSEMLGSQSMVKMIETLRGRYDHIILDSPPVTAVTDAVITSRCVDGVLLVIRAGETHREIINNAIGLLQSAGAHILGAILNGVDMGRDSYYYYQYYYYYYGEDGEKKKKIRHKKRTEGRYYGSEPEKQAGEKPAA